MQEIDHPDIAAEGVIPDWDAEFSRTPYRYGQDKKEYEHLWDQINGRKHPWDSNPWVWCLSFRRVDPA